MGKTELKLREKFHSDRRRSSTKSLSTSQEATTVASSVPTTTFGGGDGVSDDVTSLDNSMQELVAFDDEGHPFIDINKLAFKPRKKYHDHQKEKLSWYVPDFSYIVFNFMSLGCSTYFILIGNTTLTWKASIGMFSVPNCYAIHGYNQTNGTRYRTNDNADVKDFFFAPCEIFLYEKPFWDEAYDEPGEGYNFSVPGSHPILRTKLTDVHYFGLVLICVSFLNALNVCVGINACLQGYKAILYGHMAVDGVIVLVEFIICAAVHFTGRCEEKDVEIIRVVLQHFIRWYGITQKGIESESAKEKLLTTEVDSLQIGLGCCGADGWQDYLGIHENYPMSGLAQYKSEIEETESVIPFSCCRPWWIRNVYCAHGAHRWGQPLASPEKALQFHERINQESCIYKLEKMCYKIKSLMGVQGFITTFVHLAFIIIEAVASLILIRNINNLIKEKKRINKEKEISNEGVDSMDDFDAIDVSASVTEIRKSVGILTKVAPPTEDQIITIKQRTNFNQFITKVKTSHVGRWMKQAQEKVTEGHDDEEEQVKLTAAEKKAREKELLHKAKAARTEDDIISDDHGHRHHHRHHQQQQKPLRPLEDSSPGGKDEMPKPARKNKVKLDKIRSKLDTGKIIRRKSRKTMTGLDVEAMKKKSLAAVEGGEEPPHMDDEGYKIAEEVDNKLTKLATKYGKRKSKKSLKKVGGNSSSHNLLHGPPRKSKAGQNAKSGKGKKPQKGAENVDSTTVLWQKGDDGEEQKDGEPTQADASVGADEKEREGEVEEEESEASGAVGGEPSEAKPKKKLKKKTSKSLKARRSKGSTVSRRSARSSAGSEGSESSSDEEEDGSKENQRRKHRSRKTSRKKRIRAAKKKRDKNKFRPNPTLTSIRFLFG